LGALTEMAQELPRRNVFEVRNQMSQFAIRAGRGIAAATILGAFALTVPLHASRAQESAQPSRSMAAHTKHGADRSEERIKELHDKLRITPAQESLWNDVAQIMRENAKTFRASVTDRSTRLKTMNAVDDLRSFEVIADEHSEGLKRLVPAFAALYAAMTPEQQKHADHVFGAHEHHAHI
jgi:periplasmic protein CpxP/Spy